MGAVAWRPRAQRPLYNVVELVVVGHQAQTTERQHAPALLPHVVDIVDLEVTCWTFNAANSLLPVAVRKYSTRSTAT